MTEKADQTMAARWAKRSKAWAKSAPKGRSQDDSFNRMIIAELDIRPGETILDIAGGSGNPSVSIADSMEGDGMVLCTDLTPKMLETARGRAENLGLDVMHFTAADMMALPVPDGMFDCVTCRFGLMYAADKIAAAREALRTLKPGGRIAYVMWGPYDENPPFFVPRRTIASYFHEEEPPPAARHCMGEPGAILAVLDEAGFVRTEERELRYRNEVPDMDVYIANGLRRSFSDRTEGMDETEFDRLKEAMFEAWAPYVEDGQLRVPNYVRMGIGWKAQ